ncbi:MAG: hypothetical protein ASARMPRED_002181 [Alectoria sarmentosa]|nr:MAG: hypothetical protein ASARMPRED_002181 [Alectoria sarmentosa]
MSATEHYRRLGAPTTLLGWSHHSWTITDIRLILDHYKWNYGEITKTKLNLMHELHLLVQEYGLEKADRTEIFSARRNSKPFPRRRPRLRKVPHRPFPDWKAIARSNIARNQAGTGTTTQPAGAVIIAAAPPMRSDAVLTAPVLNVASALPADCVLCFETLGPQNTPKRNSHLPATTSLTFADLVLRHRFRLSLMGMSGIKSIVQIAYSEGTTISRYKHAFLVVNSNAVATQTANPASSALQRKTRAEEVAATQYLITNVKLCPRCNVRGEKVSGCDHMTCPQCRYQYCWACLADYAEIRRNGNYEHEDNCRYHSNNLPGAPGQEAWVAAQAATAAPALVAPQAAAPQIEVVEGQAI